MPTPLDLVTSQTFTASGNSDWFPVPTGSMLQVGIDITGYTGSAGFTAWLQWAKEKGGTPWDMMADQIMPSTGVEVGGTEATNKRDICDDAPGTGRHSAVYKHFPAPWCRLVWDLDGTNVTFSACAVVK